MTYPQLFGLTTVALFFALFSFQAYAQTPINNIGIEKLDFSQTISGNSCLSGSIRNNGSATLNSFKLKWQVNNGITYTRTFENLNVPVNATYNFANGQPINSTNYGNTIPISIWLEMPNGVADADPADNSAAVNPLVLKGVVSEDKRVLLEEFSGAWCGWCPDGAVVSEQIASDNAGEVYLAKIHGGDAMAFFEGSIIKSEYPLVYPGGLVDRVWFEGQSQPAMPRTQWATRVDEQLDMNTTVCVSIVSTYNSTTRVISATVYAEFVDYMQAADYRVNLYVLEDKVTGTGNGYNQANYYSGNPSYPNHPLFNQPSPIIGYEHNHTLRAVPTTAWGDNTVIPTSPTPGTYSKTYNYTVPANFNAAELSLIAFVSEYNADKHKRQIHNVIRGDISGVALNTCNEMTLPDCPQTDLSAEIEANYQIPKIVKMGLRRGKGSVISESISQEEQASMFIYPNPVRDRVNIKVSFQQSRNVTIDLYNSIGQRIVTTGEMASVAGVNNFFVDTWQLDVGLYQVVLRTDDKLIYSKKFIVAR